MDAVDTAALTAALIDALNSNEGTRIEAEAALEEVNDDLSPCHISPCVPSPLAVML